MKHYDRIQRKADALGIDVTPGQVSRIAGTLRFAATRATAGLDPLIERELLRLADEAREQQRQQAHAVAVTNPHDTTFQKIDASLQQGMCPRCGRKMRDVKLADNTPAVYCDSECRITLWPPEKESK